jgi:hypothetical protein
MRRRPMRPERLIAAVAVALLLGSCATLDESECRSADWFQLGARDGADGSARSRIEEHRKACAEFGLAADDAAWFEGYEAGLLDYCTAGNGYRIGRRGGYYGRVCPAQEERAFLDAYELGHETYEVEREITELDRRAESLQQRLVSDKLDADVRRELRRQLADVYNRGNWLRRSLDRLEREAWRLRQAGP